MNDWLVALTWPGATPFTTNMKDDWTGLVDCLLDSGGAVLSKLALLHGISSPHPVGLLVYLRPMVVTLLVSSGDSKLDLTCNLLQALVGLPGQLLSVPLAGHSLVPVALGHTDDIDHLILETDCSIWNIPLNVIPGKVDLELDFHDMGLLLSAPKDLHLFGTMTQTVV